MAAKGFPWGKKMRDPSAVGPRQTLLLTSEASLKTSQAHTDVHASYSVLGI